MKWQLVPVIPIHLLESTVVFAVRLAVVLFAYWSDVEVVVRFIDCLASTYDHTVNHACMEGSGRCIWPASHSDRYILVRQGHALSELLHIGADGWLGVGHPLGRSKEVDRSNSFGEGIYTDWTVFVQCISVASTVVSLHQAKSD